ncbi:MtrB/PioB family decaheme-associated outer membrane protein [Methyloprofundus sp.]|uniref:MtrB/PioB family decaheme-associated outer membrane protein n=1 Tax=Methyloprofundus sp. TaxID=2020875 RepID=UPI003D0F1469
MACSIIWLSITIANAEEEDSFTFDDDDAFMLDDETEDASAEAKDFSSYIELGGLYNSSNSQKFGEYSGLNKEGGYVIGNFDIQHRDAYDGDSTNFWRLKGTNVGLDSRFVGAEYGQQGLFKLFFEYDQLPHNQAVGARTPFAGVGTDYLRLPDPWVRGDTTPEMSLLNENLSSVDIGTERRKYTTGFTFDFTRQWNIKLAFQHEDKDGLQATGAVMGVSGFNPLAIVAPRPIDQETNDLDMQIAFNGEKGQVQLGYQLSLFNNHNNTFSWDNPYTLRLPATPPATGFLDTTGGLSTAPDNQAHKISLNAAYRLAAKTRLNGSFSYGLMLQDAAYIGYTVNPLLSVTSPVPRQDADAQAETLHANLVFTTVPIKNVDIRSSYTYDQRSNDSPMDYYDVLRNDSENQITQNSSQTIRENLTYGRKQHKFKIDSGYRFLARNKLTIGYAYERNDRDYAEVDHTDEHNAHIKLASRFRNGLNGWLKYEYISRNASEYSGNSLYLQSHTPEYLATVPESVRFENDPLIRQYNLADVKRNKVSFALNWLLLDPLSIGFNGRYNQDDFDQSELGLTFADSFSGTLDLNYAIIDGLSLYGFYSYEYFQNQQDGYTRSTNVGLEDRRPEQFWAVNTQDKINTFGVGVDWSLIRNVLDLQLDYTYSDALTETNTEQGGNLNGEPLPDLKTLIHSLNVRANYRLLENMRLQLSYRYEFFVTDDYALDNISPDSIDEVLSLGNSSPDYNAHVVGLSAFYEF